MSDFFISYTNVDRPWAEWVDQVVREAGFSTVIQARDFVAGDSFVEKMDESPSPHAQLTSRPDVTAGSVATARQSAGSAPPRG